MFHFLKFFGFSTALNYIKYAIEIFFLIDFFYEQIVCSFISLNKLYLYILQIQESLSI